MNEKNNGSSSLKIVIPGVAMLALILCFVFYIQHQSEKSDVQGNYSNQNANTFQKTATSSDQVRTSTAAAQVVWQEPAEIKDLKLTDLPAIADSGYEDVYYNQFEDVRYYKVGKLSDPKLSGDVILLTVVNQVYGEMYSVPEKYFFVQSPQKIVLLQNHSSKIDTSPSHVVQGMKIKTGGFDFSKFTADTTISLRDLILPQKITFDEPRQTIQKRKDMIFSQSPELQNSLVKSDLSYPQSTVLMSTSTGLFYIKNATPIVGEYEYVPDFFDVKTNVPQFTWSNGQKNSQAYKYFQEGCHMSDLLAVSDLPNLPKDKVVSVGKNSYDDTLYELKDADSELLKLTFKNLDSSVRDKESYETFVKNKPLLFWTDPFGRTVRLKNAKYYEPLGCD